MSSYTISTLVPYYVDVKAEKRTWDCPCSKCQESGNEIAVEGPEERAKAAKALLESTTKHQEIQYSPPDVMSPNFQTFVCTECIERKERSRDDPKDPIHWIPRTVPELKARLSHFGRLLIHKAQLYDKTVSWGPTAPFYEDHVLAFIGVCVSVVLIRMLEGLAALQILHRKLADGGRHQKMAVVVCLSSIYVACWIGQSRGY